MKNPYEKIIRIEIASLFLAVSIGTLAIIKGYYLLLLGCFYLIALSLFCEAMVEWYKSKTIIAGKQFIRALMLIIITSYVIFKL